MEKISSRSGKKKIKANKSYSRFLTLSYFFQWVFNAQVRRYSIKVISYSPRNRKKTGVTVTRREGNGLSNGLVDSRWHAKIRFFPATSFHDESKTVMYLPNTTPARTTKITSCISIVTSINHNRIHLNNFETNFCNTEEQATLETTPI